MTSVAWLTPSQPMTIMIPPRTTKATAASECLSFFMRSVSSFTKFEATPAGTCRLGLRAVVDGDDDAERDIILGPAGGGPGRRLSENHLQLVAARAEHDDAEARRRGLDQAAGRILHHLRG